MRVSILIILLSLFFVSGCGSTHDNTPDDSKTQDAPLPQSSIPNNPVPTIEVTEAFLNQLTENLSLIITQEVDGRLIERPVLVEASSNLDLNKTYPLLFLFHGNGGNIDGLARHNQADTFQNTWYKDNWQSLPGFKDIPLSEAFSTSIANETDSRVYRRHRNNIMGYGDSEICTQGWFTSSIDGTYDTFSGCNAALTATPYLAYLTLYKTVWIDIPQDYYDLGWWGAFEKHIGMTKQEF